MAGARDLVRSGVNSSRKCFAARLTDPVCSIDRLDEENSIRSKMVTHHLAMVLSPIGTLLTDTPMTVSATLSRISGRFTLTPRATIGRFAAKPAGIGKVSMIVFRLAPKEYGGIEFHSDALIDSKWKVTKSLKLPDTLRSGVYGVRLRAGAGHGLGEEYLVFLFDPRPRRDVSPSLFPRRVISPMPMSVLVSTSRSFSP